MDTTDYRSSWETEEYEYHRVAFCRITTKAGLEEYERIVNHPLYTQKRVIEMKAKGGPGLLVYYVDTTMELEEYEAKFGVPANPAELRVWNSELMREIREQRESEARDAAEKAAAEAKKAAVKTAPKKKVQKTIASPVEGAQ